MLITQITPMNTNGPYTRAGDSASRKAQARITRRPIAPSESDMRSKPIRNPQPIKKHHPAKPNMRQGDSTIQSNMRRLSVIPGVIASRLSERSAHISMRCNPVGNAYAEGPNQGAML